MRNPYEVLKISKNATPEQIKSAYRELAKKYHPDNYETNPLSDLAAEKMKEINEAYNFLINKKTTSSRNSYSNDYNNEDYSGDNYVNIRRLISNGMLGQAEQELDSTLDFARNAEWYFLKGIVMCKKGWFDDGYSFIERACRMDSSNREYQDTLNRLSNQRNGNFTPYGYGSSMGGMGRGGCSCSDLCLGLMCMDCCCSMQ